MKRLLACICCILAFVATPCMATKIGQTQIKLKKLNSRINQLETKLETARDKRSTLNNELKSIEKQMSDVNVRLTQLDRQLAAHENMLKKVRSEQLHLKQRLNQQQSLLAQQIRYSYQLGQHEYIKLWLNQQSPSEINRILTYYQYFNKARSKIINDVETTLQALAETERSVKTRQIAIQGTKSSIEEKRKEFQTASVYQQHILNKLNQSILGQMQQLKVLHNNKRHLENLVYQLRKQAAPDSDKSFVQMKHKLPWPTHGRIGQYPSKSTLGHFNIQYSGVFFKAPENRAVKAIFPGKVVFADWLRGYGLLMIIEHPGGYMSLYAHNNSLFYKVGEKVNKGDLIAKVGKSGGFSENGLYFEIRHQGKPVNPRKWLHG